MEDNIIGFIVLLCFLTFLAALIWFVIYFQRKLLKNCWEQFRLLADELGLPQPDLSDKKLIRSMPFISGTSKGMNFMMRLEMRGSGKSRTYYTVFAWMVQTAGTNTITVYKENFFTTIGKAFGMQDIQTGIETFDKKFILRSNNPDFAIKIFTDRLCMKMEDGATDMRMGFHLNNNVLEYAEQGYVRNEISRERLSRLIALSRAIADTIDKGSGHRA